MNITEELKTTLNKTLEIALGIEKVNSMINPRKAHTEGKNLVNIIYKEIQVLSNFSRGRPKNLTKNVPHEAPKTASARRYEKTPDLRRADFKRNLSRSINQVNQRVKMSRAGKRTVGQLLNDESLPFNKSFDKALSSREGTPRPTSLPFVSLTTGKTEQAVELPGFQEYLENKGSNYLKRKFNDDLIGRFDKASANIVKFREDFDSKAHAYLKVFDEGSKRASIFKKPSHAAMNDSQHNTMRKRSILIKNLIFSLGSKNKKIKKKEFVKTQPIFGETIRGFNMATMKENQKFLDIINKIDLERPQIFRQKVGLIQSDNEQFRNHLHSLKKFEKFRVAVESSRRKKQNLNYKQGLAYMNIIEAFRMEKYKPSAGELEILEFWKKMVEFGWAVSKTDLEEVKRIVKEKEIMNVQTEQLLEKLSKVISIS